ncbi:hypothetical protein BDZ45DRAFT_737603 [Acephala macrosclerotiorum]|nr:hypothetical protein BDZ45DRAFT_737603 [Acephala macrosclerotiorum]
MARGRSPLYPACNRTVQESPLPELLALRPNASKGTSQEPDGHHFIIPNLTPTVFRGENDQIATRRGPSHDMHQLQRCDAADVQGPCDVKAGLRISYFDPLITDDAKKDEPEKSRKRLCRNKFPEDTLDFRVAENQLIRCSCSSWTVTSDNNWTMPC